MRRIDNYIKLIVQSHMSGLRSLRHSLGPYQDIGRLDVVMDNSVAVEVA